MSSAGVEDTAEGGSAEFDQMQEHPWFYLSAEQGQEGPIEAIELAQLLADGVVADDTPVWCKELGEWLQLMHVEPIVAKAAVLAPRAESAEWYSLDHEGQQTGPMTTEELGSYVAHGYFTVETPIWSKAIVEWAKLGDVPALAHLFAIQAD